MFVNKNGQTKICSHSTMLTSLSYIHKIHVKICVLASIYKLVISVTFTYLPEILAPSSFTECIQMLVPINKSN